MSTLRLIFLVAGLGFGGLTALVSLAQGIARASVIATPALLLGYMALGRHDHS